MNLKVIFSDVDGTLTESRQEAPREIIRAIVELNTLGFYFIPITGGKKQRCEQQLVDSLAYLLEYPSKFLFVCANGAECYYPKVGSGVEREIWKHTLKLEHKEKIYDYIISLTKTCRYFEPHPNSTFFIEDKGAMITFSLCGQDAPIGYKKQFDPTFKKRQALLSLLKPVDEGIEIMVGGTSSLDFIRKGSSKKNAILDILDMLHLKKEQAAWIGDATFKGGNDCIDSIIKTYTVKDWQETLALLERIKNGKA